MIKRRGGSQIGHLMPDHKPLENMGQMSSNWGMLYTLEKYFSGLQDIALAFSKQI
jgi:hypothetical protein